MRDLLLVLFLLPLFFTAVVEPSTAVAAQSSFRQILSGPANVSTRFLDLRSYLFHLANRHNFSLIMSNDVVSNHIQVKGETVREVLNNYLEKTNLAYRYFDDCLFVAGKSELENFFKLLPEYEMILPLGRGDLPVSGAFRNIELSVLLQIIRAVSGVEVRAADDLRANMMMRLDKVPWKRLVLAIVFLNRYRMLRSDFSVIIAPEQ